MGTGVYEKNNRKQKRKRTEFSKLVIGLFATIEVFVTLFACYMVYETKDLSPLMYLIPSVSVVGSAAVASYFNKAKLENKIKLMKAYNIQLTENSFNQL